MSDFRISQSACDPVASADQSREVLRSGQGGEAVATRGHGRYYEAASRGRVFVASYDADPDSHLSDPIVPFGNTATSSAGASLLNPINSKKLVIPIRWEFMMTITGGMTSVGYLALYYAQNVEIVQPRNMIIYKNPIGDQQAAYTPPDVAIVLQVRAVAGGGAGIPFQGSSFASSVSIKRVAMLDPWIVDASQGGRIPFQPIFSANLYDRACILTPGTSLHLLRTSTVGNNVHGVSVIVWEEVDL